MVPVDKKIEKGRENIRTEFDSISYLQETLFVFFEKFIYVAEESRSCAQNVRDKLSLFSMLDNNSFAVLPLHKNPFTSHYIGFTITTIYAFSTEQATQFPLPFALLFFPQKKTHFLLHEMNRWMIQSNGVW